MVASNKYLSVQNIQTVHIMCKLCTLHLHTHFKFVSTWLLWHNLTQSHKHIRMCVQWRIQGG